MKMGVVLSLFPYFLGTLTSAVSSGGFWVGDLICTLSLRCIDTIYTPYSIGDRT